MINDDAGHPNALVHELAEAPGELAPAGTTAVQIRAFLAVAMAKHREG